MFGKLNMPLISCTKIIIRYKGQCVHTSCSLHSRFSNGEHCSIVSCLYKDQVSGLTTSSGPPAPRIPCVLTTGSPQPGLASVCVSVSDVTWCFILAGPRHTDPPDCGHSLGVCASHPHLSVDGWPCVSGLGVVWSGGLLQRQQHRIYAKVLFKPTVRVYIDHEW